jgi:hypothetical protein
MATHPSAGKQPLALSIDPGYNTVDWFLCQGMTANDNCSGAVQRGMGVVMSAIAESLVKKHKFDATPAELVRRIDRALSTGEPFELYGRRFPLQELMHAGDEIIQEAAQANVRGFHLIGEMLAKSFGQAMRLQDETTA